MGAGQSSPSSTSAPPKTALHVLRIAPASPAARTGLEPFFDFIAGLDGAALVLDELERVVEAHEGRTLELVVWSSKTRQTRVVPIVPSRAWSEPSSSTSPTSARPSLLGLSMRVCTPAHALDSVWHVLDVLEGSPGESAGLVPYGDWIVGWSGGALKREQDFYDLIEQHEERPLRVYVYSYDFDTLREVVLVPNRHWGGDGLLGCVFGFGLLHRIPDLPADAPQNVIFRGSSDAYSEDGVSPVGPSSYAASHSGDDQHVFVPADEYADAEFAFPGQTNGHAYAYEDEHEGQDAQYAGYALDGSLPSGYPAVHEDDYDDDGEGDRTFTLPAPPPASALAEPVSAPRPATPPSLLPPSPDPRAHLPPPSTSASTPTPLTATVPRAPPPTALDPPTPDARAPIPSMSLRRAPETETEKEREREAPQLHAPQPLRREPTIATPWSPAVTPRPGTGAGGGGGGSPGPTPRAATFSSTSPSHGVRAASPFGAGARAAFASSSPPHARSASPLVSSSPPRASVGVGVGNRAASPFRASSPLASSPPPSSSTRSVGLRASTPPMLGQRGVGLGARTFSGRGWGGFSARTAAPVGVELDLDLESVDGDTETEAETETETETETESVRSDLD